MLRRAAIPALLALVLIGPARAAPQELIPGLTYERKVEFTTRGPVVVNVLTVPRTGVNAGQYNLTVAYAQADKNTGHPYNTDIINRTLVATEAGGKATATRYRHNYTWDGFWLETSPIDLVTPGGAVTFGNPAGWGPNVDWVQFAPLVVANRTTRR